MRQSHRSRIGRDRSGSLTVPFASNTSGAALVGGYGLGRAGAAPGTGGPCREGAYGYVSDLPDPDLAEPARVSDLWCWSESRETTMISPAMFKEFILPSYAEVSNLFGLTCYGCCDPVNDRLETILRAIPNVRSVSVSAWADFEAIAEMLGRRYVYSRKPNPVPVSGSTLNWHQVEDGLRRTYVATRDCNVELLVRDVYTIDGDRPRIAQWVKLAKSIFGL